MGKAFFCLVLLSNILHAQTPDSLFLTTAKKNAIALYTQTLRGQTALYNGSQYKRVFDSDTEHRFYKSDDWINGIVTYQKLFYDNLPLMYDITQDRIITENIYNGSEMMLINEKLDGFIIGEDEFVKLNHKTLPEEGFFQLLYNGPSKVIAKHIKIRIEEITPQAVIVHYEEKHRYYVYRNDIYLQVKSRSAAIKLFADKKNELKSFTGSNRDLFREDFASALTLLAKAYDALNRLQ